MVARVVSLQGSSAQAGIMMRETLNPGANHVYLFDYSATVYMSERTSTGASSSYQSLGNGTLPYWIKAGKKRECVHDVQFRGWSELAAVGASQTVSMAPNVYVGLA